MKIDVVMCTYNSNKRVFPLVLEGIRRAIPLNRLIVVDRHSRDGTVETIKKYFPDALIIRSNANLAYARHIGIRYVETEWFAFIDDDAIVLPHWFKCLYPFTQHEDVGAVEGGVPFSLNTFNMRSILSSLSCSNQSVFVKRSIKSVTARDAITKGLLHLVRGFTINTLIRTEAVKDWKPNPYMGAWDDYSITQHVINKGYKWLVMDVPLCIHGGGSHSWVDYIRAWFRKGLWHGSSLRYTDIPRNFILLHSLARITTMTLKLFKGKDPLLIGSLAWYPGFFIGMNSRKYIVMR